MTDAMRTFESGAIRHADDHKHDYEGCLSPVAIRAFAAFMHAHQTQADGELRASDNWQKGFPLDVLMKSAFRHFMDVWTLHRGQKVWDSDGNPVDLEHALCGLMFNVQGYLHAILTTKEQQQ